MAHTLRARLRLDAVVDAKHVRTHLDDVEPDGVENEAVEQIAYVDVNGRIGPRSGAIRPGQLRSLPAQPSTRPATSRSGRDASQTTVVIPDQPRSAAVPSSPVKRVTTQKYESLK